MLAKLGYRYDLSLLPTFYAPLLRGLQRALSNGHVDPTHDGRAVDGSAPLQPYQPDATAPHAAADPWTQQPIGPRFPFSLEAPITTMPLLRLPMHSTFVLSLGQPLFDAG